MPSIRIEYYKGKELAGGRFPIAITVTHKGRPIRKYIDACLPSEWDKDKKQMLIPNGKAGALIRLRNQEIHNKLSTYTLKYSKLLKNNQWEPEDVFSEKEVGEDMPATDITFWHLTELYLKYLREEKSGATCLWFEGVINKFKCQLNKDGTGQFIDIEKFKLSDFSDEVIDHFRRFMITQKNSSSTMNANFKILRFVSNYAAQKGLASKPDALHNFKLPKRTYGAKKKLDDTDMDKFRAVHVDKGSKKSEIKDMFLLCYLFRGMRISDMIRLKHSFIQGNTLVYVSSKNEKLFEMKIPKEALKILGKYPKDAEYVFSFYNFKPDKNKSDGQNRMDEYQKIKSITANINNKLKELAADAKIEKNISTHIARHSFAKKALETFKGDTNLTMDLLGHNSLAVHQAYVRELSRSDDLNDAVDQMFE